MMINRQLSSLTRSIYGTARIYHARHNPQFSVFTMFPSELCTPRFLNAIRGDVAYALGAVGVAFVVLKSSVRVFAVWPRVLTQSEEWNEIWETVRAL